ncbi:MAG TPA: type II toxin-antitoxin system VapB family antitoxin [Rhizomicrobium sp.]
MGALNIKDAEVAKKARKLAKLKGTTITAAVEQALDESLNAATLRSEVAKGERRKQADKAVQRFQAIVPPDSPIWSQLEDMYDENGLPK